MITIETIIRIHTPSAIIDMQRDEHQPTKMKMIVDIESDNPVSLKFGTRMQYDEFMMALAKAGDQFFSTPIPKNITANDTRTVQG